MITPGNPGKTEKLQKVLARLGLGSRMIVTCDLTQSDLPEEQEPGLRHSLRILRDIKELEVCRLPKADIVRHDLVQRIVQAYDTTPASESP